MKATPAAPILLPKQSPSSPYELYVYTSEPGDVLFFPESYAHIVLTHAGVNVMINYRKFHIWNMLHQPLTWIAGRVNGFRSPLIHDAGQVAGNAMQQQYVPEKQINQDAYNQMDQLCKGESLSGFDLDMLKLLDDAEKKYKQ
jgi:hypothetical protein